MDRNEKEFLKNYDAKKYEKPSATVDMLVFTVGEKERSYRELPEKSLELLLIKRKGYPFKDMWAIPGGFANIDEDLYDSAKRELQEETNLSDIYMEQLYTWGDVGRDPRTRVISTSYMALVPKEKLNFKAGDDAAEAKMFSVKLTETNKEEITERGHKIQVNTEYLLVLRNDESDITVRSRILQKKKVLGSSIEETLEILESDMAFDHSKIVFYAINRLRNKAEYTTIVFNLIDEVFTIGELQTIYETILDTEYSSPNFRRKIMPMLEEVETTTEKNRGHRPAQTYRLSDDALFREFNI